MLYVDKNNVIPINVCTHLKANQYVVIARLTHVNLAATVEVKEIKLRMLEKQECCDRIGVNLQNPGHGI